MARYLTIIGIVVLGALVRAPAVYADSREDVHAIMEQLGVVRLVDDVPEILRDSIEQRRKETGLSQDQYQRMADLYGKTYAPDDIVTALVTTLATQINAQELATLKNLLATEQARKLIGLREHAASAAGLEAIRELAKGHKDNALSKNRQTLLETFDEAAADTEFFIAAQALTVYSIMRGFNTVDEKSRDPKGDADTLLQLIYEQLQRPSRYTIAMTLRYTFRDVEDQELTDFIQVYRFAPVQNFLGRVMEGLRADMLQRVERISDTLCKAGNCPK